VALDPESERGSQLRNGFVLFGSGAGWKGLDLFNVTELAPEQRLDEIDVCQVAIFVANMCGLEWLKDEEGCG